jgi:hypothetical protein
MNDRLIGPEPTIIEARPLHQRSKVVEGNPSIDLRERTIDNMLQLDSVQYSGPAQRQQVPPCFRGEASSLVRAQHSECHLYYRTPV